MKAGSMQTLVGSFKFLQITTAANDVSSWLHLKAKIFGLSTQDFPFKSFYLAAYNNNNNNNCSVKILMQVSHMSLSLYWRRYTCE